MFSQLCKLFFRKNAFFSFLPPQTFALPPRPASQNRPDRGFPDGGLRVRGINPGLPDGIAFAHRGLRLFRPLGAQYAFAACLFRPLGLNTAGCPSFCPRGNTLGARLCSRFAASIRRAFSFLRHERLSLRRRTQSFAFRLSVSDSCRSPPAAEFHGRAAPFRVMIRAFHFEDLKYSDNFNDSGSFARSAIGFFRFCRRRIARVCHSRYRRTS